MEEALKTHALTQPEAYITPEEYLRREREAGYKSEYYDGKTHPMSGVSLNHLRITMNLIVALRIALRDTDCAVYASEMQVCVDPEGKYLYPDLVAVCGGERYLEGQAQASLLNPTLVVEVLSPTSESFDRGKKFEMYRALDSLREYVLIAQERRSVEVFRKNEAGRWELFAFGEEAETVELASVGASVEMEVLYEQAEFEETQGNETEEG